MCKAEIAMTTQTIKKKQIHVNRKITCIKLWDRFNDLRLDKRLMLPLIDMILFELKSISWREVLKGSKVSVSIWRIWLSRRSNRSILWTHKKSSSVRNWIWFPLISNLLCCKHLKHSFKFSRLFLFRYKFRISRIKSKV